MTIIGGVDVSSEHLDARIGADGPHARFANTPDGITALAAFGKAHDAELVAMEATGGYERLPFALLRVQSLPCAILNPRRRAVSPRQAPLQRSWASWRGPTASTPD